MTTASVEARPAGRVHDKDCQVIRVQGASFAAPASDAIAIEEPLELRLGFPSGSGEFVHKSLAITMRTPGDDLDLAIGFLCTEGIVRSLADVTAYKHCGPAVRGDGSSNIVRVDLGPGAKVDMARLERHFYTSSSCGVCGKTSLEAVRSVLPRKLPAQAASLSASVVHSLAGQLKQAQESFARTGGLHAAGLFDAAGTLQCIREDVGRHNAVDKLIGAQLRAGAALGGDQILLVSGRASFELVQKALMAQIPVLAAVGAPSSLAVELAHEEGMTLLSFVRDERFNVYAGGQRLSGDGAR
jgi:FdhD protein